MRKAHILAFPHDDSPAEMIVGPETPINEVYIRKNEFWSMVSHPEYKLIQFWEENAMPAHQDKTMLTPAEEQRQERHKAKYKEDQERMLQGDKPIKQPEPVLVRHAEPEKTEKRRK